MKKFILFSLFISSFAYSQIEETQSKIKVYSPSSSSSLPVDNYKWTVKTDVLSFISGEIPIIGEYRALRNMSVEASVGLTYGLYNNFGIIDDTYEGEGTTFDTKASFGNSFRVGIKYYPSSDFDALEGWAFGVQFFSRKNNRDYNSDGYPNNRYDLSSDKDSKTKTGLALTISKQIFSDSNVSIEWIVGIGFANMKHKFLTENIHYSGSNNSYYLKSNTTEEKLPNFQLGFRIGFGN